jgi:hypothetical protein
MRYFVADAALVSTSSVYALWLRTHKELEPNWTWAEVVFGVGYCLIHAEIRGQGKGGDWRRGQREVLRSLALGAIPIIAGEMAQTIERRRFWREFATKWR